MSRYLIIFVVLSSVLILPQQPIERTNKTIRGIVLDSSTSSALPFANITLHLKSDSSFITGASTDAEGKFELDKIKDGEYFVKISFVGYNTKYISDVKLNKDFSKLDLGKIQLSKVTYELNTAEVVGEKVNEELHLDKKVINVSQNLNAQGGTALDVLQNQPSVRVDPDGTVYLRGSSNFTILVNGKPYPLQGADALKQISANSIDNIELITNPSSRYEAEGSAGIININLKKQKDYSLSGILNLNGGTGDKYNADGTLNYNLNGLSLNAGIDYRDFSFTNEQEIIRNTLLSSGLQNNNTNVSIKNSRQQYGFRGGMDYNFNENQSLGLSLSLGAIDISGTFNSRVMKQELNNTKYTLIQNRMEIPVKYFNTTLNYQYKFEPNVSDIYFEATYNYVDIPNDQITDEYLTDNNYNLLSSYLSGTSLFSSTIRNELRSKLNFKNKFSETTIFESGIQGNYSLREIGLTNKIFDKNLNEYVLDNNLSNNFNLRNNVYAGFISLSSEFEGFKYMLGLRGEYTDRYLEQKTLSENFNYQRMDFFPSINISRKIEDHQLQLSYSRRINRPNENMLNPFPNFADPNIKVSGNPKLRSEYIDALELNYQKMFGNVFFSAQTYYRKTKDSFNQTFSSDSSGKLLISFDNYGNLDVYGAELSSSFSIAEIFRFDPSINLFQTHLDGIADRVPVVKDYFNWGARLNTTITFSPTTRFMLSTNYIKFVDAQSESEPFMLISASLRQEFFDKQLSLTLQARNLFKASDMKIKTNGANFDSRAFVRPEAPLISLMLTYNFNNFKRSQRPTETIDIPTGL
jgi:outer membrane receptor protein involved in Fe transport